MSTTKRKRVDDGPRAEEELKARSDIWFNDGNIILEAQGKQFRVHRGVLAKHSDVFKDMFDVPTPPNDPTVEGCQIVHLTDSAQDVEHLLSCLYDWLHYSSEPLPVRILSALVRLGHKYAFLQFRDEAVSRLEYDYPNDIKNYLQPKKEYALIRYEEPNERLDILNLAREYKLHTILPSLYMELFTKYHLNEIIAGVDRKDGTSFHLPQDEKLVWAVGFSRYRAASMKHTFYWMTNVPYEGCTSRKCRNAARVVSHGVIYDFNDHIYPCLFDWNKEWEENLCESCVSAAKVEHEEELNKIWEAVPSFFGLPSWGDLSNFDFN
ncbi:hypothetical protein D9615_008824 [Tricholomella constricta]|uniref:BTB domain-containing protein n=1 Tax=Tricholomella constricta TaxID=117010 RepID=A0A8H5H006_9AGAR|nr:hypothetical protein D9615_008824 [Tricholomella constricta]